MTIETGVIEAIGNGLVRFGVVITAMQIVLALLAVKKQSAFFHARTRLVSFVNLALVTGLLILVWLLLINNRFDFYQVWAHAARDLPLFYRMAALWEGQEGSFLFWAFIQALVAFIFFQKKDRLYLLAGSVLLLVQLFLLCPLVQWPWHEPGISLFSRTLSVLNIPEGSLRAGNTLADGAGMNPLLRNVWMTVHPPVIFAGFALSAVPYALTVAGRFIKNGAWLPPAAQWLKYSAGTLTIGILMGAWWAYETLNFGGYWSWDPVENAVYLPWLVSIAALHVNWLAGKRPTYARWAYVFNCLCFIAVVYATFLTRSGLLGDTSVHAFTGSGYGVLLALFLVAVLLLPAGAGLLKMNYTTAFGARATGLPNVPWPFVTAIVLAMAAFQVFVYTSWPVLNAVADVWRVDLNIAPPATTQPYVRWQGSFTVLLLMALFVAEGAATRVNRIVLITVPVVLAGLCGTLAVVASVGHAIVVTLALANAALFVILFRKGIDAAARRNLSGSLVAHAGVLLLVAGILCSNRLLPGNGPPPPAHYLLTAGVPAVIEDERYTYEGRYIKDEHGGMINASLVMPSACAGYCLARQAFKAGDRTYKQGDVVRIKNGEHYYRIQKGTPAGDHFFAHVHFTDTSNYYITPSIHRTWWRDTYLHLSNLRDDRKLLWNDTLTFHVAEGHSSRVTVTGVLPLRYVPGVYMPPDTRACMLTVDVNDNGRRRRFTPIVIAGPAGFRCIPDLNAANSALMAVSAWTDTGTFTLTLFRTDPDWITLRAETKPLINLFWLGGLLMAAGIMLSAWKKRWAPRLVRKERRARLPLVKDRIAKKRTYATN